MDIRVKRAYRAARRSDGARALVDRFWPRGLSRERLRLDHGAKGLAPSRPFGVNLIPAATGPVLFDEELAACVKAKVHSLVFFWDVVPEAVAKARSAGCRVLYQIGSVEQALAAETAGAGAVTAQGVEAGGHVLAIITSLVLLPPCARRPKFSAGWKGSEPAAHNLPPHNPTSKGEQPHGATYRLRKTCSIGNPGA